MPGFLGFIGSGINEYKLDSKRVNNESSFTSKITWNSKYFFDWNINKKFINDKIFYEDENYLVITDGVLLNSNKLMEKYKGKTLANTLIRMYQNKNELFFNEIRGSYSCVFHDKKEDLWLIYTDHVGDKKVYYSFQDEGILLGSRIIDLANLMKINNKMLTLDEQSCLCMLTFGYMIDDNTMVEEIKKLLPGQYIKIKSNNIDIKKYFEFNNEEINSQSDEEIIEELDKLFRNAVKMQFDKDLEYGYKHISSLSGGLDSRMVNFVADDLGYKKILNYTFSQSNYLDEKIAKEIAVDLNHEFVFKSLDDAKFLYDIEDVIRINGGTSIYYGLAHSKNNLEVLNLDQFGLIHTGQIGDVVIGSFSKVKQHSSINFSEYVYSTMYQEKLNSLDYIEYKNDELFKMYNRGFNFALNGNLSFQERTESFSPFYDVEFMQFCFNIPLEKRVNHELYYKWILKKYPDAANYTYERIKSKINTPEYYIRTKNLSIKVIDKVLRTLKLPTLYGYNTKRGMNPFDYWFRKNQGLNNFISDYYDNHVSLLDNNQSVKSMCEILYNKGITVEKIQVLTVLSTVKVILGESK